MQLSCIGFPIIDPQLLWILGATLTGGALSIAAAAWISLGVLRAWTSRMVSFAVGSMLAATFLHLLPEAFGQADSIEALFGTLLAGILAFFLLEKATLWRHDHTAEGASQHGAGTLILVGDGVHNFVDGVLIAAAFLADVTLGLATTLAIVAHEIPQEIGDFMVLLHSGYSKSKALWLNLAASLMSVAGGVAGYLALSSSRAVVPYLLVLASASFIYIAVADLIPHLRQRADSGGAVTQIALIGLGIVLVAVPHVLLHSH